MRVHRRTYSIVEGMNRVMKHAPADRTENVATSSNPDLLIAADVPRSVAAFVKRSSEH
jgi:hypothetical protein